MIVSFFYARTHVSDYDWEENHDDEQAKQYTQRLDARWTDSVVDLAGRTVGWGW